jgi:hypothetical protein
MYVLLDIHFILSRDIFYFMPIDKAFLHCLVLRVISTHFVSAFVYFDEGKTDEYATEKTKV